MQKLVAQVGLAAVLGTVGVRAELPAVDYVEFATGYGSPLDLLPYRDGAEAFLVIDQPGVITFLDAKGGKAGPTFLDLRDRMVGLNKGYDERGLLGFAFHPKFAENGKFYVYYSAPLQKDGKEGYDHTSHLSEFKVKEGGHAGDPESERILLRVDQPQWNHNGGRMLFGKDGYLYLALGDGGAANDKAHGHEPEGNGQALERLLGKVLRIDVDGSAPYGIPADNPLVGKEGRDEIYAWGFRNPWGMTFDRGGDGALILADVGQNRYEEIDVVTRGGNFGWPRFEAEYPFSAEKASEVPAKDGKSMEEDLIAPILSYPHNPSYGEAPAYGISVTGGHVYRGKALPELAGVYLFADYAMSWATSRHGIYAGVRGSDGKWTMEVLPGRKAPDGPDRKVVGMAQDGEGEIYILINEANGPDLDRAKGAIWKMVPGK